MGNYRNRFGNCPDHQSQKEGIKAGAENTGLAGLVTAA
jgi:hypothetical protein